MFSFQPGWKGAPFQVLDRVLSGDFQLLTSPALLQELQRVLGYAQFPFSEEESSRFLLSITEAGELVHPEIRLSVVTGDPDDDRVLEFAVAGAANLIVSGDAHLKGRKSFQGISILSPAEFLERFPA